MCLVSYDKLTMFFPAVHLGAFSGELFFREVVREPKVNQASLLVPFFFFFLTIPIPHPVGLVGSREAHSSCSFCVQMPSGVPQPPERGREVPATSPVRPLLKGHKSSQGD